MLNSVDEYSEKERKLLEAIIEAIHGLSESASQGVITSSTADPLIKHFFKTPLLILKLH